MYCDRGLAVTDGASGTPFRAQDQQHVQWAGRMAHAMLGGDIHPGTGYDWQDLQQVALIAFWQAGYTYDAQRSPDPVAYAKWRARSEVKSALRPREKHVVYRDAESDDVLTLMQSEDPAVIDIVIAAYHAGEVARALDSLTPGQLRYVVQRFWGGLSTAELTTLWGYDPNSLWHSKKNGARQRLAVALAHLLEV